MELLKAELLIRPIVAVVGGGCSSASEEAIMATNGSIPVVNMIILILIALVEEGMYQCKSNIGPPQRSRFGAPLVILPPPPEYASKVIGLPVSQI